MVIQMFKEHTRKEGKKKNEKCGIERILLNDL